MYILPQVEVGASSPSPLPSNVLLCSSILSLPFPLFPTLPQNIHLFPSAYPVCPLLFCLVRSRASASSIHRPNSAAASNTSPKPLLQPKTQNTVSIFPPQVRTPLPNRSTSIFISVPLSPDKAAQANRPAYPNPAHSLPHGFTGLLPLTNFHIYSFTQSPTVG
jgi:hypothetical protein